MARYKRWEDHSPRWIREHTKAGESKERWNSWLGLSPRTRKSTSIRDYAKGASVRTQLVSKKRREVTAKATKDIMGSHGIIERGVSQMTPEELRWTAKASKDAIKARAKEQLIRDAKGNPISNHPRYKYIRDGWNPWWYKGSN